MPAVNPAEEKGCVFKAAGLNKEYDDDRARAFRRVHFRVTQEEFVAVIGPGGGILWYCTNSRARGRDGYEEVLEAHCG